MALEKYPNRRIYDTELHQYITVAKLRPRLLNGERITYKKTGADATGEALVGLMMKDLRQGQGPDPELLRSLIQGYTKPLQSEAA